MLRLAAGSAYDIYLHIGGGYVRRAFAMVPLAALVLLGWPLLTNEVMRRDPAAQGRWSWRAHVRSARRGQVFSLARAFWDIRLYFSPRHHPGDLPGSLEQALEYLATAPSVLGHRGRRSA